MLPRKKLEIWGLQTAWNALKMSILPSPCYFCIILNILQSHQADLFLMLRKLMLYSFCASRCRKLLLVFTRVFRETLCKKSYSCNTCTARFSVKPAPICTIYRCTFWIVGDRWNRTVFCFSDLQPWSSTWSIKPLACKAGARSVYLGKPSEPRLASPFSDLVLGQNTAKQI